MIFGFAHDVKFVTLRDNANLALFGQFKPLGTWAVMRKEWSINGGLALI